MNKKNIFFWLLLTIYSIVVSSCMSDQEFHCNTNVGIMEFGSTEDCMLSAKYPNDYYCRTKLSKQKFTSIEECIFAKKNPIKYECKQPQNIKHYKTVENCVFLKKNPEMADLENRKKLFAETIKSSKSCTTANKSACEVTLRNIEIYKLESDMKDAALHKRRAFSSLCDAIQATEKYCVQWFAWESNEENKSKSAVNGCKVFNGQSCLNLYQLLSSTQKKSEIKDVFNIAAKSLKMECYAGDNSSCSNLDSLAGICDRTDFECKVFRTEVMRIKNERIRMAEELADEKARHQYKLRLERERNEIQKEMLASQKRSERLRMWQSITDSFKNSISKPSTSSTCSSSPNYLGGYTTRCQSN